MRYFLLSSCLFIFLSCTSVFKGLQKTTGDIHAIERFRPVYSVALYRAQINVVGNYLSGLLLIKKMPDGSTRLLFSNELGFKFFDFGFSKAGDFKVYYIMEKMDRKAVLKTLRKDFQLLLMEPLDTTRAYMMKDDKQAHYYIFPQQKGFNYYVTRSSSDTLLEMARASKTKKVVTAIAGNYRNGLPDTIGITHHNVDLSIGLKRIEKE